MIQHRQEASRRKARQQQEEEEEAERQNQNNEFRSSQFHSGSDMSAPQYEQTYTSS